MCVYMFVCVFVRVCETETKLGKGQMFVPGLVSCSVIPALGAAQDFQLSAGLVLLIQEASARVAS